MEWIEENTVPPIYLTDGIVRLASIRLGSHISHTILIEGTRYLFPLSFTLEDLKREAKKILAEVYRRRLESL